MSSQSVTRTMSDVGTGLLAGLASVGVLVFASRSLRGDVGFLMAYLSIVCILFASTPIYMVGLARGWKAAAVAMVVGTVGLFPLSLGGALPLFLVAHAIPAFGLGSLAVLSRQNQDGRVFWFPEGYLVLVASLYPCLLFLGAAVLAAGQEGGLLGASVASLQEGWAQFLSAQPQEVVGQPQVLQIGEMIPSFARMMPSTFATAWMSISLVIFLAAHWLVKKQGWNIRPSFSFHDFVVPGWVLVAVALTGVVGYVAPDPYAYYGTNLCVMLCVPFFFLGLAVLHAFAARWGGKFLLGTLYFVLMVLPWFVILVALLGTLDIGLGLRQRMTKPIDQNGVH